MPTTHPFLQLPICAFIFIQNQAQNNPKHAQWHPKPWVFQLRIPFLFFCFQTVNSPQQSWNYLLRSIAHNRVTPLPHLTTFLQTHSFQRWKFKTANLKPKLQNSTHLCTNIKSSSWMWRGPRSLNFCNLPTVADLWWQHPWIAIFQLWTPSVCFRPHLYISLSLSNLQFRSIPTFNFVLFQPSISSFFPPNFRSLSNHTLPMWKRSAKCVREERLLIQPTPNAENNPPSSVNVGQIDGLMDEMFEFWRWG